MTNKQAVLNLSTKQKSNITVKALIPNLQSFQKILKLVKLVIFHTLESFDRNVIYVTSQPDLKSRIATCPR